MKKTKLITFLIVLFLGMVFIMPVKLFAYTYNPAKDGEDFSSYINDIWFCDLTQQEGQLADAGSYGVYLYIDDLGATFQFNRDTDFHEEITSVLHDDRDWTRKGFENLLGIDTIYWNPWAQYWQIDYPDELEYYKERVSVLEDLVSNLTNQLHLRNIEIQDLYQEIQFLNSQIQLLLNENQQLEGAYNVGYHDGFNDGYKEAIDEIDALEEIVPSAFGSIWLVIKDFLSIEVLGIAIWEVIGAFVSVALAIIIIRMFIT